MIQNIIYQQLKANPSNLNKQYRVLWHQTLETILKYYELPKKTYNFDVYPLFKNDTFFEKSYSSTMVSRFDKYIADTIVTETWEAKQLSTKTGFYYELKKMCDNDLNSDEYLIWYPKDRTDKAFIIEPISLFSGSVDRLDVNPVHDKTIKDFGWLNTVVEFSFKIKKNYETPNFSIEVEDI